MLCALRNTSAHGISFKWYSSVIGWVTSSKPFIQTAVRLDVEIFGVLVRDVEQLLRIAVDRTAVVDFEFNAEMPQTFAVEHEVGRVAVLVDDLDNAHPSRMRSRRCRHRPNTRGHDE